MAVKEFRDPAEPSWEQLVNELKSGEQLKEGAITSEKLATSAVATAKLANEAVTGAKIAKETVAFSNLARETGLPTKPAEKAVAVGNSLPARKVIFAVTGDGAQKKWKCKHEGTSWTTFVTAYEKGAAENETKTNLAVTNWTHLSVQEVEVELTAAVAAATVAFIAVWT